MDSRVKTLQPLNPDLNLTERRANNNGNDRGKENPKGQLKMRLTLWIEKQFYIRKARVRAGSTTVQPQKSR